MNATTGQLLLTAIIPIIQSTVPQAVAPVGSDDYREMIQDAIVSACQMAESMERSGKPIIPNIIAYYSIQRTKSGRRSYGGGRTDALSAGAILDGNSIPLSLDAAICDQEESEDMTIGDMLADEHDDPGMLAAKNIDWDGFRKKLATKHRQLMKGLAKGERPTDLAVKLSVSPARITQMKREIGVELKDFMGKDILAESMKPAPWQRDLRMNMEKAACRADR